MSQERQDVFIHESSYIDEPCSIGTGTKIWHFCHIMKDSHIGERCNIGQNVFIAAKVRIGSNVKIQNNVSIYTGVILEDDVFCGPSMVFTNVINPRSAVNRKDEYLHTLVKRGASIGANATIVCGHTVGQYAFIGAGAVITKSVPDYALMIGNPARLSGWMCQCGIKLSLPADAQQEADATCQTCQRQYHKHGLFVKEIAKTNVD
jgi:UDP-2-acetamido-3-amino-2,3-dideoxy-glucuronate N-acetyltransferase